MSNDALKKIFGVPDMPALRGAERIHDDFTAGYAAGVSAVVEWLRAIPHIEMPTHDPHVVSLHDMSAKEAAGHLEEIAESLNA